MNSNDALRQMSLNETIGEAIQREKSLINFYRRALRNVGPEARPHIMHLLQEQCARIKRLRRLAAEVEDMNELTEAIAD